MAIITFVDADGVEQTLDTSKPFNIAYHVDCLEFMKAIPEKLFDLCCADPPYGDGTDSSQIGNVERERERSTPQYNRFGNPGSRFERYKEATAQIPRRREERPVEEVPPIRRDIMSTGGGGTVNTSNGTVARTGGTWAEKYGKKS